MINLHTSIDDAILTDLDILSEINLWIDLASFTNDRTLGNVGKCTDISILRNHYSFGYKRWLFDARFLWIECCLNHIQEHAHCGTSIGNLYHCCLYFALNFNRLVDKDN